MVNNTNHRFIFLDGLRGVAALSVVLFHLSGGLSLPQQIPHASLAVDFFFMLSGFVIAFAYEQRLRAGTIGLRLFFVQRIIRLYPMILLGLFLGTIVFFLRLKSRHEWGMLIPFFQAGVLGLLMIPSHVITGTGYSTAYPFNVPAWSLFFEFWMNVLYAAVARSLSNLRLIIWIAAGAAGVFWVALLHNGVTGGPDWENFALGGWRVVFGFLAGVLLYRMRDKIPALGVPSLAFALAIVLIAALASPMATSWLYDSICVFVIFPGIIAFGSQIQVTGTAARLCSLGGQISYPLYLLHYPIVRIVGSYSRVHNVHGLRLDFVFAGSFLAAVALSAFCMTFVDAPLRRAISQWLRERQPGASATMVTGGPLKIK